MLAEAMACEKTLEVRDRTEAEDSAAFRKERRQDTAARIAGTKRKYTAPAAPAATAAVEVSLPPGPAGAATAAATAPSGSGETNDEEKGPGGGRCKPEELADMLKRLGVVDDDIMQPEVLEDLLREADGEADRVVNLFLEPDNQEEAAKEESVSRACS